MHRPPPRVRWILARVVGDGARAPGPGDGGVAGDAELGPHAGPLSEHGGIVVIPVADQVIEPVGTVRRPVAPVPELQRPISRMSCTWREELTQRAARSAPTRLWRKAILLSLRLTRPRTRAWLALGVASASVTITGCSSRVEAERIPPPPVVTVVEARRMTVPIMAELIDTTRALQEVSIRARVRGYLKEMHFQVGADVKKGQLLFVIDEVGSRDGGSPGTKGSPAHAAGGGMCAARPGLPRRLQRSREPG
jgi:hypothetical protein